MPFQGVIPSGVTFFSATWEGITPPSWLIQAHAPDQNPPLGFALHYSKRSLQVVVSPCWKMAFPSVISADPPLGAWTLTPVAPMVHIPISSHRTSAFPVTAAGRLSTPSTLATSVWLTFRGCSHSFTFRPPGLLATLVAPTMHKTKRQRLLHPGRTPTCYQKGAPDMLAVRTGKLTAGDFNPIRSAALLAAPQ